MQDNEIFILEELEKNSNFFFALGQLNLTPVLILTIFMSELLILSILKDTLNAILEF